jgi:hypothetical protein
VPTSGSANAAYYADDFTGAVNYSCSADSADANIACIHDYATAVLADERAAKVTAGRSRI